MSLHNSSPGNGDQTTAVAATADEKATGRPSAPATPAAPQKALHPQRQARLEEFAANCLQEPAVEEGLLGVTSGLLLGMVFQLDAAVQELTAECGSPWERVELQTQASQTLLPLCRQIDRLTGLRHTLAVRREKAAGVRRR